MVLAMLGVALVSASVYNGSMYNASVHNDSMYNASVYNDTVVVYTISVPLSSQDIAGYVQLTNNGMPGPCRGDSPTDNDRGRWEPNLIVSSPMPIARRAGAVSN